ncbi:MAG: hypothetical protein WCI57_00970 [Candidatus Berkelbacteria bacterium]
MTTKTTTPKLYNSEQASIANKIKFIKIIGFVGILIIGGYSISNYIIRDYPFAIMENILVLLLIYSLTLVYKNKVDRGTDIGAFVLAYITLHNFSTGGYYETGMLWTFMFPSLIFVIQGKKRVLFGILYYIHSLL